MLKRYKSEEQEPWIETTDRDVPERYDVSIYDWNSGIAIVDIGIDRVLNLMECIGCSKDDIVDMTTAHIDIIEPKAALGV